MHTEDEAKKLWCPQKGVDGSPWSEGFQCCIASKCMAWRWAKIINPDHQPPRDMWPDRREPHEKELYIDGREKGYCGLAGKT